MPAPSTAARTAAATGARTVRRLPHVPDRPAWRARLDELAVRFGTVHREAKRARYAMDKKEPGQDFALKDEVKNLMQNIDADSDGHRTLMFETPLPFEDGPIKGIRLQAKGRHIVFRPDIAEAALNEKYGADFVAQHLTTVDVSEVVDIDQAEKIGQITSSAAKTLRTMLQRAVIRTETSRLDEDAIAALLKPPSATSNVMPLTKKELDAFYVMTEPTSVSLEVIES